METEEMTQQEDPAAANIPYLQQMERGGLPPEILTLELDYNTSLEELKRKLAGEDLVYNAETQSKEWKVTGKPWVNSIGIDKIIGIIKGHVDINTFLSMLTESEINTIMHGLADEITTILSNKCKEFDIDCAYLGVIHSMVVQNIFFALKRAQGGMTLKQIHGSTHRIETHNPQQPQVSEKKSRWKVW